MMKKTTLSLSAAVLTFALATGGAVQAQELGVGPMTETAETPTGERFGDAGQLFLTSALQFDFVWSKTGDGDGQTNLRLAPSLGFFVAQNLALGGTVALENGGAGSVGGIDVDATEFSVAPFVGYNLWVGEPLSIMPILELGYAYRSLSAGDNDISGWALTLGISAPVLFHPVPHFFLGLSPFGSFDLVAKFEGKDADKTNAFGLNFILGGWF